MDSDRNPFAPPQSQVSPDSVLKAGGDPEELRRHFMNREACVKAVGWLFSFSGAGELVAGLIRFAAIMGAVSAGPPVGSFNLIYTFGLAFFLLWTGYGVSRLKNTPRLAAIGLCFAFIIYGLFSRHFLGVLIQGCYVACLFGSGAREVCSRGYRDAVDDTTRLNGQIGMRVFLIVISLIAASVSVIVFQFAQMTPTGLDQ